MAYEIILINFINRFKKSESLLSLIMTVVIRLGSAFSQLVLSILLVRIGGLEAAGYFFFLYGLVLLFSAFTKQGLGQTLLANLKNTKGNKFITCRNLTVIGLVYNKLRIKIIISCALISFVFLVFNLFQFDSQIQLLPFLISIVTMTEISFQSDVVRGTHRTALSQLIFPLAPITIICLSVLFSNDVDNSNKIAWILAGSSSVTWLVVTIIFFKLQLLMYKISFRRKSAYSSTLLEVNKDSRTLGLVEVSTVLFTWLPIIVLQWFSGSSSISQSGIYALAARFAKTVQILQSSVDYWLGPRLGGRLGFESNPSKFFVIANSAYLINVILTIPFCILLIIFGENLLLILFGQESIGARYTLSILAVAFGISVCLGPASLVLSLGGYGKFAAMSAIGGIVILISSLALMGTTAIGAAFSVLIALTTRNLIAYIFVHRKMGVLLVPVFATGFRSDKS